MGRFLNWTPLLLTVAIVLAFFFGQPLALKATSLLALLWWGMLLLTKAFRKEPVSWDTFFIVAFAAVAFVYSMGWL